MILDRFGAGLAFIDRAMFQFCAIGLFVIMVLGATDVILNNTIGSGVPATIDISQVMFVSSVFLALPIVVRKKEHIRIDLFVGVCPDLIKKIAEAISVVLSAAVYLFLAYAMWNLFQASWRVNEQSLSILTFPIYPIKFLAFLGLAVATLIAFAQIADIFRKRS
ncbi:TRAP-type C4-dicarboxylate transport system permease small subunit [Rhodoligotrophos appendicifer]|uniref:TRAP transporter small permease subunit n=1 Tax=Rhodoligotrophos appendicifer TaxID=987056 RepID=UPI00147909C5|nr:TRAP transporter small permease [Rhodoligotrophos appendicifer]